MTRIIKLAALVGAMSAGLWIHSITGTNWRIAAAVFIVAFCGAIYGGA